VNPEFDYQSPFNQIIELIDKTKDLLESNKRSLREFQTIRRELKKSRRVARKTIRSKLHRAP